jgi:hypothetical protein
LNRKRTFQMYSQDITPSEIEQLTIDQSVKFKTQFYKPEAKPQSSLQKLALKQIGYEP